MDKAVLAALLTIIILVALFSALALVYLYPRPQLIDNPAIEYNARTQNATATTQGSTLAVSFNYSNHGTESLTVQRFYLYGTNNEFGGSLSGVVPQQDIPGLIVYFNGTAMKNPESFNFVLKPHDSVLTNITIPNYTQYVQGTYLVVNVVQKGIITGFPAISIS